MVRFRRRLLARMIPLAGLSVLAAAAVLWLDQQSARARLAEAQLAPALARADAAEARALKAEASLTAIAQQRVAEAAATATVVARVAEPQRALERNLARLFAVFQEPTGGGYAQLADFFSAPALQTERPEADYLRSTGRHLGGASTFNISASPPDQLAAERAQTRTTEPWLDDERDASEKRVRCFIEDSDQTYVMRLNGQTWVVDEVQLGGTKRTD